MPFLHPILFWLGVGGISIPIIIHILNRRRFRIVDWAAMRFLLDALRKNRRRLRIEELILLALRCLMILLLGFGLARFSGCGEVDALGAANGGRAVVFVLDDSYSMAQARGASTPLEMARNDLTTAIASMTSRDEVGILRTSKPQATEAFFPFGAVTDPATLNERIGVLEPSDRRTRLVDAMTTAAEWFDDAEASDRRLYLLSDMRRVDLTDAADTDALQKAYARLRDIGVEVVVMDYGKAANRNLTLERMALASRYAAAGQTADIQLAVRNNGTTVSDEVQLELSARLARNGEVNEVKLPVVTVPPITPGDVWQGRVEFTPETPGSTVLAATLPADDLAGDNTIHLALDVRSALRVLIVDGKPEASRVEESGSYFLRMALDPTGRAEHGFAVDVISPNELAAVDYRPYHVVYLANLASFPLQPVVADASAAADGAGSEDETPADADLEQYASLAALESYVRNGGGVVIYTGENINTRFYNGRFYDNGRGLLPLPVQAMVGDPADRETFFRINGESIQPAAAMNFFAGEASVLSQLIRFYAFTPADDEALAAVPGDTDVPVIEARFNDPENHPAVVSRSYGQGRVVTIYSSASLAWNDWAVDAVETVRGVFVLFVADLTEQLARSQGDVFTRPVGSAIAYDLTGELRDAAVTLRPPEVGADLVILAVDQPAGRQQVRYADPQQAGVYALELALPDGQEQTVLFARNVDPVEGDLAPASETDIDTALGDSEYTYLDRAEPSAGDIARAGERKEYWMWAIVGLLVLLALENDLARRFGHWS